ncbi:hypothetical protein AHAS_Ahas15G0250200 [Arachis hypogaea]
MERRGSKLPNGLIQNIRRWLNKDWVVKIEHTFIEGNKAADFLAKKGLDQELGYHFVDMSCPELSLILEDDYRGISMPRAIRVM